ncbi:MAG: methionine synthase [Acidobacteria bacterium]|nr:methionine synthase [Acidobacteriota bacterium]
MAVESLSRPELSERGRELEGLLRERILVLDGATGTMLQRQGLTDADFGGQAYEGCNEFLVVTRPDVVQSVHAAYLEAGADIVETNTFGATPVVLAEYGLQDRALEINEKAARLAREVAARFPGQRFVAGSMGPTTKAISVTGGMSFEELSESYRVQALGLLRGGADVLVLETAYDTRNVKAGIIAIEKASHEVGFRVPLMLSATIEQQGTMLAGQAIDAFYASVEHAGMTSVGLNCATGPEFMTDHIRTLARIARCFISCYPNAGLPDENGRYRETPGMLAEALGRFVEHGWVNLLGGCCGTSPDHIRAIADVARAGKPRIPVDPRISHLSGIEYVACEESSRPLIVGERTNVNGSRKFRELVAGEKFEEASEIGRKQVKAGAQILDICMTSTERDEALDLERFLPVLTRMVKVPLMFDSMDPRAIERALTWCQGKAIINSINLEDGEDRFARVVPLALRYGAALVVGCIDEQGQAITAEAKLRVADRSFTLLRTKYGVRTEDIIWDALVFPCASGDKNYVGSAAHTVEAVRLLKERYPETRTVLGISNVSFGLPEAGREVLNAVFLYHATKAGLDYAIVSSEKLVRYASIPEEERRLSEDLLFNRGNDPIAAFAAFYRGKSKRGSAAPVHRALSLDERLARYVVEGSKDGLIPDIEEKLKTAAPLDIVNGPLMKGMEEVGRLFNNNELIVAEVLQSAEVMKAAVAHLEKYMERRETSTRGKLLLATVKGDVHDIGKNLVEIILSNNGYQVVNLGIKVPPGVIIEAVREHKPDLIGLSGLLVKSAQQMVVTAEDIKAAGIRLPILVGGAALTKKFTYTRIQPAYGSTVVYAKDAMNGLDIANQLIDPQSRSRLEESIAADAAHLSVTPAASPLPAAAPGKARSRRIQPEPPRRPPNLARHIVDVPIADVWPYINRQMLLGKHMGLRGPVEKLAEEADAKYLEVEAIIRDVQQRAESGWMRARGVYRYFQASADRNDIVIYDDAGDEIERFTFPRQPGEDGLCLADFVAPGGEGHDSVGMFVVTCGHGIRQRAEELKEAGQYLLSHALQALAIESAEAMAELVHRRMRTEWGIADPADLAVRDILQAHYRGLRVSFGYPACPNLADQDILWRLLTPREIGVQLTDGYMMDPEASVSALVFHHPQARYFNVAVSS